MNIDPTKNVIAFEIEGGSPFISEAPTRDENCVQKAWSRAPFLTKLSPRKVREILCEWQPTAADADFIRRTFPNAEVSFTFERPGPDGWDSALAAAREVMLQEQGAHAMDQVDADGVLLPVLWSQAAPGIQTLRLLPHRTLIEGKLYVAVATVATTPEGRIGMNHVALGSLDGRTFDDFLDEALGELTRGLRVEGMADPAREGEMAVMRRQGPFAASAVALPDFYAQISSMLGSEDLLVGLPDPDTVLITPSTSGWADELRRLVLNSPDTSREFVPCVLMFDAGGMRLIAERASG